MGKMRKIHWGYFFTGLVGVLALDLLTKWLAVQGFIVEKVIIKGFFYLTPFQKNDGIAFGIDLPVWIQIAGSAIILVLLVYYGFDCILSLKKPSHFKFAILGVVVGGGLGNLFDRIINGYVVDFIVLRPIPVFNVADIGITVGIVVLFGTMVLMSRTKD